MSTGSLAMIRAAAEQLGVEAKAEDAVVVSQPPKRRLSSALLPALLGVAMVADSQPMQRNGGPMSREDHERRHADRMSRREGKTARAEIKRKRKADRRLALKSAGEVPSSVTSINNNDN